MEVNGAEPSPSVRVPWLLLILKPSFTLFLLKYYLKEEVNRTEPPPSVSVPWFKFKLD